MKQFITDYSFYYLGSDKEQEKIEDTWDRKINSIGLLNIDTNNTIELVTFTNEDGLYKKSTACYYKVLGFVRVWKEKVLPWLFQENLLNLTSLIIKRKENPPYVSKWY